MGPPRVKAARPPSRSRFQEGSMNDRASAAPPVQFLGADERAMLEQPLDSGFASEQPPLHQTFHYSHQHQPRSQSQPNHDVDRLPKKTRLLGQMWDGVWGRLGFRRDNATDEQARVVAKKTQLEDHMDVDEPLAPVKDDRPTREEVLANYHQLVASGFFSAHAIQSTRRPAPGTAHINHPAPPPPSRMPPPVPTSGPSSPTISLVPQTELPPAWPLTPPHHEPGPASSPLCRPSMMNVNQPPRPESRARTPASAASSRGTKRAADSDNDDEMQQLTPRKLRKSTSRDIVSLPKLRSVGSRRALLRRSFSIVGSGSGPASGPDTDPQTAPTAPREPAKLTKRVLAKLPGQKTLDMPIRRSSSRRNASESQQEKLQPTVGVRLLRSRNSATEPMRIVPDANRGIPHVPAIPEKFTYGQDRENGGPWRGLRW